MQGTQPGEAVCCRLGFARWRALRTRRAGRVRPPSPELTMQRQAPFPTAPPAVAGACGKRRLTPGVDSPRYRVSRQVRTVDKERKYATPELGFTRSKATADGGAAGHGRQLDGQRVGLLACYRPVSRGHVLFADPP